MIIDGIPFICVRAWAKVCECVLVSDRLKIFHSFGLSSQQQPHAATQQPTTERVLTIKEQE